MLETADYFLVRFLTGNISYLLYFFNNYTIFSLSFVRASPKRSLLNIGEDTNASITERAITLINPHLNVTYVSSNKIEQRMNRLKAHSLSYTDYPLKSIILSEGMSEYNMTLMHGKITLT